MSIPRLTDAQWKALNGMRIHEAACGCNQRPVIVTASSLLILYKKRLVSMRSMRLLKAGHTALIERDAQ